MTCRCHDPITFGHLACPHWQTQPRSRQSNPETFYTRRGYHALDHTLQALTQALRSAEMSFETAGNSTEALRTALNPAEAIETDLNDMRNP